MTSGFSQPMSIARRPVRKHEPSTPSQLAVLHPRPKEASFSVQTWGPCPKAAYRLCHRTGTILAGDSTSQIVEMIAWKTRMCSNTKERMR